MPLDDYRDLQAQARLLREHADRCREQVQELCADSDRRSAATRLVLDRVRPGSAAC